MTTITKTENYIRELYFILFAQKKIILLTTALIFILSILIAFFWPPTYSASETVLVRAKKLEKSPEAIEDVQLRPPAITKEDLLSEVNILTSPDIIERTIKYLVDKKIYKKDLREKTSLTEEIYKIKNNLRTEIIPASNVIEVAYYDKNAKNALNLLQVLMDQYIAFRFQVYHPGEAEIFYSQQSDKFKDGLETKEDELMGLVRETNISDPQKEIEKNLMLKNELEKQLNFFVSDAIEKDAEVRHLETALKSEDIQFFSFIENIPLNELSSKLQDLFIEREKTLRAYNPRSEKIQLIDKQINNTYKLLKSEVNAYRKNKLKELNVLREKIKSIQGRIDNIDDNNVKLKKQLIDSQRIGREINLFEFSHETFSKRREEAKTATAENVPSDISILSRAFPSNGPVFPKKTVVIPLGLLVGFLTGFSLGFLRQYFDHTFKKPSDVENYLGLPVIFSIPKWGVKK